MSANQEILVKKCTKCGLVKPLDEFYIKNSSKDHHTYKCKECFAKYSKEYHQKNKELCRIRLQKWRAENSEYVKERDKKYRESNMELCRAKERRYRERHPEKIAEKNKKYRESHREYFYNKAKERKSILKSRSDGTVTKEELNALFKSQNGCCAYCGCDLNVYGKHTDHVIPISKGGLNTISNIRWVCPTCNLSKGYKTEEEWTDRLKKVR